MCSIETPMYSARRTYSAISNLGSTTAATPGSSSPIRYEAQPRSSWVICLKIMDLVRSLCPRPPATPWPHPLSRRLSGQRLQRGIDIGQLADIHGGAGADQGLDMLVYVPHVHVHPRDHSAVAQP